MGLVWLCRLLSVFKYFGDSKGSPARTHSDIKAPKDCPEGYCYEVIETNTSAVFAQILMGVCYHPTPSKKAFNGLFICLT